MSLTLESHRAGGRLQAIIRHQAAVAAFVPKLCLRCGAPIVYIEGHKISEIRRKKFCTRSCSARHHNHSVIILNSLNNKLSCTRCGNDIVGTNRRRKFCNNCLHDVRSEIAKANQPLSKSNFEPGFFRSVRMKQLEHEQAEAK